MRLIVINKMIGLLIITCYSQLTPANTGVYEANATTNAICSLNSAFMTNQSLMIKDLYEKTFIQFYTGNSVVEFLKGIFQKG